MRMAVIFIEGKSDEVIESLVGEYLKRTKWKIELIRLKAKAYDSRESQMKAEGVQILERVTKGDYLVCLDAKGKQYSSERFASMLNKIHQTGRDRVVFSIGGAYGLDAAVKSRADSLLSLSEMTFPHKLARLLLVEQLYRVYTMDKGIDYHH